MFKHNEYLEYNDNEVIRLDAKGKKVDSKVYESAKEAHEAFMEQVREMEADENTRFDFVSVEVEFPPQKIKILVSK